MHERKLNAALLLAAGLQMGWASAESSLLFVFGDTGDCSSAGTARVAAALRAQPGVANGRLLELGDLAYPAATRERLLECHEPHFAGFPRRLAVPGNHDWRDPGAAGFFSLFPDPVPREAPLGGPWKLLLLDSNLRGEAWEAQLKWLDATLARSRGECLIAAWHHPRWSSGKHGDNDFVDPLWRRLLGKATFTLHGHDHHFEALPALDGDGRRSAQGGLPSFVAGNGGAHLYPPGKQARSERAYFGKWGFMRLELDGRDYRWQAVGVDGGTLDAGAGTCRPAP